MEMTMKSELWKLYIRMQDLMAGEEGQDLIEYALVIAWIAFAATTARCTLASNIKDATPDILEHACLDDPRVKLLRFSRNFGHQAAVTAGLDFANGDAVVVMDADLQDPPELLPRMLDLFEQGYDVVSPQRISREAETRFKRWTSTLFYRALSRMADQPLTPDVGDFRMFSRRAVGAICSLREQHRYMRGMVAWLGLKEATLPFERRARAAAHTNYPLLKMLRFAWTGVSSFSAFPLRISIAAGVLLLCAGSPYAH